MDYSKYLFEINVMKKLLFKKIARWLYLAIYYVLFKNFYVFLVNFMHNLDSFNKVWIVVINYYNNLQ